MGNVVFLDFSFLVQCKSSSLPQIRKPFEKFEEKTPNVFYFNLGEDADYHGDDDQFDTLERHRRTIALPDELPSIIHEGKGTFKYYVLNQAGWAE